MASSNSQRFPELSEQYRLGKTVGCGGFAKVKLGTHILTGEQVAIKIMDKKILNSDLPRVYQEIDALKTLNHPHICKLYQILETESHFFLIMEYCSGGELFDHIVQKERLSEDEARIFFRQIVDAVAYCHQKGYTHRDLKPENILLDADQNLKLVDFGLCIKAKGTFLYTSCGSPNYVAPELIKGEKYVGPKVDIWSLGVLLYALLCGNLPFEDDSIDRLYKKIMRGCYEIPEYLSPESSQLLSDLLQIDATRRISTEKLMTHPWIIDHKMKILGAPGSKDNLYRDEECLGMLARALAKSTEELWLELLRLDYDYQMATYFLLIQRKQRKKPLRLLRRPNRSRASVASDSSTELFKTPARRTYGTYVVDKMCIATPTKRRGNLNGKRQRIRSPGLDDRENAPAKRLASGNRTPKITEVSNCNEETFLVERRTTETPPETQQRVFTGKRLRSRSLAREDPIPAKRRVAGDETPQAKEVPSSGGDSARRRTPLSARRVLNALERGLRIVLTPRRSLGSDVPTEPAVLPATQMSNVTSTNSVNPEAVINSLQRALSARGVECDQKGFTLRGKLKRPGITDDKLCKLSFELEVCWIPRLSNDTAGPYVGIRRKRLKGDAWIYKTICEQVLAVASAF